MRKFALRNLKDMSKAKEYNPKAYEGYRGKIKLPHSIRTYFDGFAHEFNEIDKEQKLLDLGYVLKRGYDLSAQIKACLYDRPHINEDEFKWSLGGLIEYADADYMRDNGYNKEITTYSIDDLVSVLSNILDDRYIEYSNLTRELL